MNCCLKFFIVVLSVLDFLAGVSVTSMASTFRRLINAIPGRIIAMTGSVPKGSLAEEYEIIKYAVTTLSRMATGLLAFGVLLMIASTLGVYGACCESPCLLYLYIPAMVILASSDVIVGVLILQGRKAAVSWFSNTLNCEPCAMIMKHLSTFAPPTAGVAMFSALPKVLAIYCAWRIIQILKEKHEDKLMMRNLMKERSQPQQQAPGQAPIFIVTGGSNPAPVNNNVTNIIQPPAPAMLPQQMGQQQMGGMGQPMGGMGQQQMGGMGQQQMGGMGQQPMSGMVQPMPQAPPPAYSPGLRPYPSPRQSHPEPRQPRPRHNHDGHQRAPAPAPRREAPATLPVHMQERSIPTRRSAEPRRQDPIEMKPVSDYEVPVSLSDIPPPPPPPLPSISSEPDLERPPNPTPNAARKYNHLSSDSMRRNQGQSDIHNYMSVRDEKSDETLDENNNVFAEEGDSQLIVNRTRLSSLPSEYRETFGSGTSGMVSVVEEDMR